MPVSFQRNGVIVWTIAAIVVLIMGYPLAALIAFGLPSLSTSGETRMIEELMTLRARTESAGHVGDKHERSWCWSLG